jgi:uncharacterized membrane protein YhiD involved in acid resistance
MMRRIISGLIGAAAILIPVAGTVQWMTAPNGHWLHAAIGLALGLGCLDLRQR